MNTSNNFYIVWQEKKSIVFVGHFAPDVTILIVITLRRTYTAANDSRPLPYT